MIRVLAVLLLCAPPVLLGQEGRLELSGRWRGCFRMAPENSRPGAVQETCGPVVFTDDSTCGAALARFSVPLDSLRWWIARAGREVQLPYNQGLVTYRLAGDTVKLEGRPDWGEDDKGHAQRCVLSGDDGSVYASGTATGLQIKGKWGVLWFGDSGPLGTFILSRE
jgi:hypothetical protein